MPNSTHQVFLPVRLSRGQQILISKARPVTRQREDARRRAAVGTSQMRDRRRGYGRLR